MFKLFIVVLVSILFSANAFNYMGSIRRVPNKSLKMADDMIGASIECGGKVYDPLGLLKIHDINPGVLPHPKWLRESELKHCRIAMLASIGAFSAQYGLVIPGYTAVEDPVTNLNKFVLDNPLAFAQIILAIGLVEGASDPSQFWFGKGDRIAGEFSYDPTNLYKKSSQAKKDTMQLQELKNGRLAMIAMAAYTSEHWIHGAVPFLPDNYDDCDDDIRTIKCRENR